MSCHEHQQFSYITLIAKQLNKILDNRPVNINCQPSTRPAEQWNNQSFSKKKQSTSNRCSSARSSAIKSKRAMSGHSSVRSHSVTEMTFDRGIWCIYLDLDHQVNCFFNCIRKSLLDSIGFLFICSKINVEAIDRQNKRFV